MSTQANFIRQNDSGGFDYGIMDRDGTITLHMGTEATYAEALRVTGIKHHQPPQPPARCLSLAEMAPYTA